MSKRINYGKPSRDLLIDLLNHQQGTIIPIGVVDFSVPELLSAPDQAEHGANTRLRLVAKPNSGYQNHVDVYYNRTDLARLFKNVPLVGVDSAFATQAEALTLLNQKYGLAISVGELEPTVPVDGTVVLRVSQSDIYLPGTQITVTNNTMLQTVTNCEGAVDELMHFTNVTFPPIANAPLIV